MSSYYQSTLVQQSGQGLLDMTKDHGQGNKRAHEEVNPEQQMETGTKRVKKQDLPETEELTPVSLEDIQEIIKTESEQPKETIESTKMPDLIPQLTGLVTCTTRTEKKGKYSNGQETSKEFETKEIYPVVGTLVRDLLNRHSYDLLRQPVGSTYSITETVTVIVTL